MRLAERFPVDTIHRSLVPPGEWRPYPTIEDRDRWDGLSEAQKQSLVSDGEKLLGTSWPELKATLFMEYQRTGSLRRYQTASFDRRRMLMSLIMAECVEMQGRFLDDIVNGIWAICEESYWGASEHSRNIRFTETFPDPLPDTLMRGVELTSAETGALLALANAVLGQHLESRFPIVTDRLKRELRDRMLDPYVRRNDWFWLGFNRSPGSRAPNNWNPWIHSNLLIINLLVETDPSQRVRFVHRVLRGLDEFLSGYAGDGGCDEGISYWGRAGASLFECLDVLDTASNGKLTVWNEPMIREIGRYVPRMHIGSDWYVNFADADAKTVPDPNIVYHFGKAVGDDLLQQHALASTADHEPEHTRTISFKRVLDACFRPIPNPDPLPAYPLIGQSWLNSIEVLAARETEGTTEGLFLAAKGGHNGESHNHNDVGAFIVGLDGHPMLIDAGVQDYTKTTFSPQRYDLWTMQSAYHNLPTINGQQQAPGPEYRACDVSIDLADDHVQLQLDIAPAWPEDAGITRWERTIRLDRGANAAVTVSEAYTLADAPESLTLTLMTASNTDTSTPGQLRLTGTSRDLLVGYDANTWRVETEQIPIDDRRMAPVWGNCITRILLRALSPARSGSFSMTIRAD